jgi:hypothetical protein
MPIVASGSTREGNAIKWWRSSKDASRPHDAREATTRLPGPPEPPAPDLPDPDEARILERLAEATVRHRMTVPAILFLESVKPLSFVGSQALYFFEPMVRALFAVPDYERFAAMMERRENVEALLVAIERKDETERRADKERKQREREERDARRKRKESE